MGASVVIVTLMLLPAVAFSQAGAGDKSSDREKSQSSVVVEERQERFLSPESPLNHEFLDLKKPVFAGETSLNFNLRDPSNGASGGGSCSVCSR